MRSMGGNIPTHYFLKKGRLILMNNYIRNKDNEILYELYKEEQNNCDGYRLKRIKPAIFNEKFVRPGERCGWLSSDTVNRIQTYSCLSDFYVNERAFVFDAMIFDSIILDTSIRGSVTSIGNSIILCGGGIINSSVWDSKIENSVIENSRCSQSEILGTVVRDSSSISDSILEKSIIHNLNLDRSCAFNSRLNNDNIMYTYISDIELNNTGIQNGIVVSPYHLTTINGIGSTGLRRRCSAFLTLDGHIGMCCGCWKGTLREFRERIYSVYGKSRTQEDEKIYKEYSCFADLAEIHFDDTIIPEELLETYNRSIDKTSKLCPKIDIIYTDEEGNPLV